MIVGIRRKVRRLSDDLKHASTYSEWKAIAGELDSIEGFDDWKQDDTSTDFNFILIRNRLNKLRQIRQGGDVRELVFWLHEGLHGNIGNISNPVLYDVARVGTKHVIHEYVSELCTTFNYLCDNDFPEISFTEKMKFFKRVAGTFGRSSLLLSGGSTMGMWHIGTCQALHEEGLMPRVISGSSAGSIIAGVIGVTHEEDMDRFYDPEYIYLHAFQALGLKEAFKKKALMDSTSLQMCLQENIGEMTFEEAFEYTGRMINITVSPVETNQQPRLLNYLTAPNVLIRQASLASCSIPGVFPPATLLAKDYHGRVVPYLPSMKWADGSLKSDLPRMRLSRLYNVNHYIVSQTNPHVVPFMQIEKFISESGLQSRALDIVTSTLRVNAEHALNTASNGVRSNSVSGRIVDAAHMLLRQNYRGDITLVPKFKLGNFARLLSNPTPKEIAEFMLAGQRQTWPHIEQIRNATMISQTLDDCIMRLKIQAKQQPTGLNLRSVVSINKNKFSA